MGALILLHAQPELRDSPAIADRPRLSLPTRNRHSAWSPRPGFFRSQQLTTAHRSSIFKVTQRPGTASAPAVR